MNYIVLAYWIMGYGSKVEQKKGLDINTQSFNLKEVLVNILRIKFNLNPRIHKSRPDKSSYKTKSFKLSPSTAPADNTTNYKIYLNSADLNKIRPFIFPCFLNHFMYKIN